MNSPEENLYRVELTPTSKDYFYDLIEYIYQHHEPDRVEEIPRELKQKAKPVF